MDHTYGTLEGKVALITGSSRGIGKAVAVTLASAGAKVIVTSRKKNDVENVAREIRQKGDVAIAAACDMAKTSDIADLVDQIKTELKQIDILVNNAGTSPARGPLLDSEEWVWDEIMNVNLKGVFLLSQLVARMMKEQGGGNIINIASVAGIKVRSSTIYSVSKAGLMKLTEGMAKEWGQYNIRVNSIAPGGIKTQFNEYLWKDPATAENVAKQTALRRWGEPEDIAQTVLFLVSDISRHITGQTLSVDGGELVGPPPVWPVKK